MQLTKNQLDILDHTLHRAPQGRYCGDEPDMQKLVKLGLMASVGFAGWCKDEYFIITGKGRGVFAKQTKEVAGTLAGSN